MVFVRRAGNCEDHVLVHSTSVEAEARVSPAWSWGSSVPDGQADTGLPSDSGGKPRVFFANLAP